MLSCEICQTLGLTTTYQGLLQFMDALADAHHVGTWEDMALADVTEHKSGHVTLRFDGLTFYDRSRQAHHGLSGVTEPFFAVMFQENDDPDADDLWDWQCSGPIDDLPVHKAMSAAVRGEKFAEAASFANSHGITEAWSGTCLEALCRKGLRPKTAHESPLPRCGTTRPGWEGDAYAAVPMALDRGAWVCADEAAPAGVGPDGGPSEAFFHTAEEAAASAPDPATVPEGLGTGVVRFRLDDGDRWRPPTLWPEELVSVEPGRGPAPDGGRDPWGSFLVFDAPLPDAADAAGPMGAVGARLQEELGRAALDRARLDAADWAAEAAVPDVAAELRAHPDGCLLFAPGLPDRGALERWAEEAGLTALLGRPARLGTGGRAFAMRAREELDRELAGLPF